ncbi:MAG: 30S ribosomal protein S13 [Candidatus Aenigmatarchaeota archaeon]
MEKTEKSERKRIVRLLEADLTGELSTLRALKKIKGVGFMFANAICSLTGVDPKKEIGLLSSDELKTLENAIRNTAVGDKKLEPWLLNRRRDFETGEIMHLTGSKLDMKKRDDINLLKRIRAYKGVRHELGQPVRGQRTRSSFRTQKTVGVSKKAIAAKTAPKKEEKK